jgi:hypothetical protein
MSRILVCSEDGLASLRIGRILSEGHHVHEIVKTPIRKDGLFQFDLLIIHSSYRLAGLTQFIEHLVLSRTLPILYVSSTIALGSFRALMDNPYFLLIDENKMDSELAPTIRLMAKIIPEMKVMASEVQKAETRRESEKMMQKCKKRLIESGMTEEDAHRFILKTAMDHHLNKHDACAHILANFPE